MLSWNEWNINYQREVELGQSYFKNRTARQQMYRKYMMNYNSVPICTNNSFPVSTFEVCPCPVPRWENMVNEVAVATDKKGKPMRYNETNAVATIAAAPSDAAIQRDYLLNRLSASDGWRRNDELSKMFNLRVDNTPKTYKQLIEAIKKGKFTLDEKRVKLLEAQSEFEDEDGDFSISYCCGPFDGIIWDGPQPDRKGYDAAIAEKSKQYTITKDIIMIGDAAAGLAALQAFEAWTPKK